MKSFLIRRLVVFFVAFSLLGAPAAPLSAQCPMCKMSAESNLKNGGAAGRGLNTGILYLLAMPYLLVPSLFFLWWRNRRRAERFEQEQALREVLEDTAVSLPPK